VVAVIPCVMLAESGHSKPGWLQAWNCNQVGSIKCLHTDTDAPIDIPLNEYYEYFGPDYKLDVRSSNAEDMNTRAYLDRVKRIVSENIRHIGGPPSVQMQGIFALFTQVYNADELPDIPTLPIDEQMNDSSKQDDLIPPDTRRHRSILDSRRQADGELSDSDDEGQGGRRDHAEHKTRKSVSPRTRTATPESVLTGAQAVGGRSGIMNPAGSSALAGPSTNTPAEKVLETVAAKNDAMEVDTPIETTPPSAPGPSAPLVPAPGPADSDTANPGEGLKETQPAPPAAAPSDAMDVEPKSQPSENPQAAMPTDPPSTS
jgi:hypothetical protein